jgi:lysophospholipase L1-like esterase
LRTLGRTILKYFLLAVVVPLAVLTLAELVLRAVGPGEAGVRIGSERVDVPDWLLNDPSITRQFGHLEEIAEQIDAGEMFGFWRFFEQDPEFHFRLRPNLEQQTVNFFSAVSVRKRLTWTLDTNSQGYRGPEAGPRRPGMPARVVCLGDSSTYGWGVEPSESYPAQLQELLDERSPAEWEVFNLGVPGYTSFQGRLLLERLRELDPDVVVISFGSNDASVAGVDEKTLHERWTSASGRLALALGKLRLARALRSLASGSGGGWEKVAPEELTVRVSPPDYRANLLEIAEECEKQGWGLVFVLVKQEPPYRRVVARLAGERRFALIDFERLARDPQRRLELGELYDKQVERYRRYWGEAEFAANPELVYRVDPTHPNALGNRMIAQGILRRLPSDRPQGAP